MKKKISMAMALILAIGGISGCKKEDQNSKDVTLKWIMLGSKQKDADMVLTEFNKKLADYLPGTKVDIEFVDGADYQEKWNLMMASNEAVDIGWSGYAVDFMSQIQQGSYIALNDLIDQYGQDMKQDLPDWLFDLGKVDGQIYCIPNYQMMASWPKGVKVLKEYSDKYLDRGALEAAKEEAKTNISGIKKEYEIWEKVFEGIKSEGKIGNGIDVSSFGLFGSDFYDTTTVKGFSIDLNTLKVVNDEEREIAKIWYETAADWYKKGYIRSDILSVDGLGNEPYKNGYISWQHNWCDKTAELESKELGVELDAVKMGYDPMIKNTIPVTSTVIARTSKNPERAMQLINLLNSEKGKDLYNLLVWGIEGTHYTKKDGNRIETPYNTSQASSDEDYGLMNWAVASIKYSYEPQATLEGWAEYVYNIDINAKTSPVLGFRPKTSSIATEIAQVSAVIGEYSKTLKYGAAEDEKALYDEYIQKMKTAGSDKIKEELQRQLDEWLKTNNK